MAESRTIRDQLKLSRVKDMQLEAVVVEVLYVDLQEILQLAKEVVGAAVGVC